MKRFLSVVVVLVVVALAIFQFRSSHPVDIIGDLEKIRNTKTEAGVTLNRYYAVIDTFDSLVGSGNYDAALTFIDGLIENEATSDYRNNYIFEKGRLLYNLENYIEAKNVLTEAIVKSDSFHLKAFVWRGYTYALLGSCDSAEIDLKFAVSRNSSFRRDYDQAMEYCGEQ
jgi:tetratricopeptide (TPR) repeat protein